MVKIWTRKEYHDKIGYGIMWKDCCPFCNRTETDIENTIWEGKYWFIIHNIYPYSWDERHLMAVPFRHINYTYELNDDELLELNEIFNFMKNYFEWSEYFSFNRDTMWHRSIEHLHIHYLPWQLKWKYLRKMLEHQWFPIKEDLNL